MTEVFYHLIEDHREDHHRSGEGAAVALIDGRLLLMYTAFRGESSADHASAEIFSRTSSDEGVTWSEATTAFRCPPGALNVMSVSLLRLACGRLGCSFSVKWAETHCTPQWTTSSDEGVTWSPPVPITSAVEYFTVNNDRLVQLRDGTIVLPYALLRGIGRNANDKELLKEWLNGWCGIFYSRDGGVTWHMPDNARRFQKDWFAIPETLDLDSMAAIELQALREKYDVFQEPGLVELHDGRLLMWVRSLCHIFVAITDRVESPWSAYRAIPGFNVSCSPQTIKRVPRTGDLVMLYNDRGAVAFGTPNFQLRTPLSLAISKDEGQSWQKLPPLEGDQDRSYCYFSLLFFGTKFLATYYESTVARAEDSIRVSPEGTPVRRNLASLKMCCGDQQMFDA